MPLDQISSGGDRDDDTGARLTTDSPADELACGLGGGPSQLREQLAPSAEQEAGQSGGLKNASFLFRVGDPGPVRLGEGMAVALSPDGRFAIVQEGDFHQSGNRLFLLSAGSESRRELSRGPIDSYAGAAWLPDGERAIVSRAEKGREGRLYVQRVPDGDPRPISPEGWVLGGTPSAHWVPCFRTQSDEKGRPARTWQLCSV
jgi:hypothetical protein